MIKRSIRKNIICIVTICMCVVFAPGSILTAYSPVSTEEARNNFSEVLDQYIQYFSQIDLISQMAFKDKYAEGCFYYAKTSTGLRMRKTPDTSADVVGTLYVGNTVKIEEFEHGWGKFTYKGKTGWCALKYMVPCIEEDGGAQYETEAPVYKPPKPSYKPSSGSSSNSSNSEEEHSSTESTEDTNASESEQVECPDIGETDSASTETDQSATQTEDTLPEVVQTEAAPPEVVQTEAAPPEVIQTEAAPPEVIQTEAAPPEVTQVEAAEAGEFDS